MRNTTFTRTTLINQVAVVVYCALWLLLCGAPTLRVEVIQPDGKNWDLLLEGWL